MKFGIALTMLQDGLCEGIRLPKWDDSVVIKMQTPDANSKMTHPYLYVESRYGCVPWKETMVELFAENWELVNPVDKLLVLLLIKLQRRINKKCYLV